MSSQTPAGGSKDTSSTRVMPVTGPPTENAETPTQVTPTQATSAHATSTQAAAPQAAATTEAAAAPGLRTSLKQRFTRKPDSSAGSPAPSGEARTETATGASPAPPAPTQETAQAAGAPSSAARSARPPAPGPRRVRLALSRVDPWSVMKLSFLLSIAAGIALVVATAVIWNVLNSMQVFAILDELIKDIAGTETIINILEYVEFSRVISISVVIAVVDIVLLTALATLGAFLYNIVAALVGGLHVTLTDE